MRTFLIVCLGQLVSLTGSGITSFALGVWIYQKTGSVTQFALMALAATLPMILISPFAGALVDRWNRRWAMILSDTGAALCTLGIAALFWYDRLEVWQLYLLTAIAGTFNAFQWPAYTAATTMIVPKEQLGQASGIMQIGRGVAQVVAPGIAGVLLVTIGLRGIILIDFVSFTIALMTLLFVRFPKQQPTDTQHDKKTSLLGDVREGWKFLLDHPGLLAIIGFFAATNLLMGCVEVLATPLVLSFTSAAGLGTIMTMGGVGIMTASILVGVWGGPKRRMPAIFGFTLLSGAVILLAGFFTNVLIFAIGTAVFFVSVTIANSSSQVILQKKVPSKMQGRIFSIYNGLATASLPIAFVLGGPLADFVFEPLLAVDGPLAGSVGILVGVGEGRGIAFMWVIMGTLTIVSTLCARQYSRLRNVETDEPDAVHHSPDVDTSSQREESFALEPVAIS